MSNNLKFLVLDGYAKAGREDLEAGGASTAGKLYEAMLKNQVKDAHIDVIYPADADSVLPSGSALADYDGIAWTGSSLTIYHETDEVKRQIDFAKAAFAAGVPSFGSCWAAQIAVVAAGGTCALHPKGREMFLARKISLTPEGRGHPMYRDKKSVFDGWISHDDEITHLPPGAILLASNDFTRVQSVAVNYLGGTFWALQYHPEYSVMEMARLIKCRKAKLMSLGFFADMDVAQEFVDRLEALHANPTSKDMRFQLGIDDDVLNDEVRCMEVKNWIEQLVIPTKMMGL